MRARSENGQATTEYVAVVLLVAVVLAAFAVVVADPGIGRSVLDGVRRGLCVVTGTRCRSPLAQKPCVVSRRARKESVSVNVAVVRLGADAAVIRELRSDGTVAVTLVGGGAGGVDIGVGLALGGYGGELRAAGLAGLGGGRTWIARDGSEADRLIAALGPRKRPIVDQPIAFAKKVLGKDDGPKVRDPDIVFTEGSAVGKLGSGLGAAVKARYGGALTQAGGMRTDKRSGRRTFYVRVDGGGSTAVSSRLLGGGSESEGGGLVFGVTLDRDGDPVEASVSASRAFGVAGQLPIPFRALVPDDGRGSIGGRLEVEARLDLAEPRNAAAIDGFLRAARRPDRVGDLAGAAADLGDRLVEDSQLDARAYRTSSSSREISGRISAGAGVGAGFETRDESAGLLGAWERPPGGEWLERVDCTEAAQA